MKYMNRRHSMRRPAGLDFIRSASRIILAVADAYEHRTQFRDYQSKDAETAWRKSCPQSNPRQRVLQIWNSRAGGSMSGFSPLFARFGSRVYHFFLI